MKSFYDCGFAGPRLIMTDDADAELTLERIRQNVKEKSVKKSAKSYLTNHLIGLKGNLQSFCNNLFSLGQEQSASEKSGKKRKTSFLQKQKSFNYLEEN